MSFIQGKSVHGLGEDSASQSVELSSWGILGKSEYYRKLDDATQKPAMIG